MGEEESFRKLRLEIHAAKTKFKKLVHPVLGPRSIECTQLVNDVVGRTVEQIFGDPDNLKFRSSMTLFANVAAGNVVFLKALAKYFDGKPDQRTLDLLKRNA